MQHLPALTLSALLAIAFFPPPAYTDTDSRFVGTWTGHLNEQTQREITVRHVANRSAYGWYCIRQPGLHQITDFHGDGSTAGAVSARATKRKLFATIRDYRITAAVNRDGDHLDVTAKSRKDNRRFELARTEPENAPCRPRIVPLAVTHVPNDDRPAGQTYADLQATRAPDTHPFVGSWTATRHNGLTIELNVTAVANDGAVQGLYCNRWASGWRATDMDRAIPGAINATATDSALAFRHKRNGREFRFTLNSPDRLTYKQTIPGKGTDTTTMVRTDDPTCAARVIVPTR